MGPASSAGRRTTWSTGSRPRSSSSARHASLWGRTNYGRAFTRFSEEYADALTPKTNLLVLGDARSNHSDLALPVVKELTYAARHSWWLNPEHVRNWNTGDSDPP